jgi:putative Mn2+ efflux pump MntP
MLFWEVLLMSVALAMDACAVAMTNGMCDVKMPVKKALLIGVFFGFFQFLMPVIGYFITGIIADAFLEVFEKISAWVSFGLLAILGGKMVWEGVSEWIERKKEENTQTTGVCPYPRQELTMKKLTVQAIATSIDALAVGVTLQMAAISSTGLAGGVWGATGMIGIVTFALSFGAVYVGKVIGDKLADKAGLFGGLVLLGIGIKILIEGLL